MIDTAREDLLVDLLNSTPVVDGDVDDLLRSPGPARSWQRARGGTGSTAENGHLVTARDLLQEVVRGRVSPTVLRPVLAGAASRPELTDDGITWRLDVPEARRMAVEAVLTWHEIETARPGRLRPCANPECRLFLLDRSKPNKARWCSMAVCGNRMKARRHYQRVRETTAD